MLRLSSTTLILLFLLQSVVPAGADVKLGDRTTIVFATIEQGRSILGQRDVFAKHMSPFDRASRMKTDRTATESEYLAFAARNVLAWNADEIAKISAILKPVATGIARYSLDFPTTVCLMKTTGKEEGGAPYTRGNAVVLPESMVQSNDSTLERILAHELFHVLSRNDPKLRDRLYESIGFRKCGEIEYPSVLAPRKITNPDAPANEHYIQVTLNGKPACVTPVLFSSKSPYDAKAGMEFFEYLTFQLMVVEKGADGKTWKPLYDQGAPKLVEVSGVSGFFEQIGRNTSYVIHPEEVLADNFAMIVLEQKRVPSPEILEKIRRILAESKARTATPDNVVKKTVPSGPS